MSEEITLSRRSNKEAVGPNCCVWAGSVDIVCGRRVWIKRYIIRLCNDVRSVDVFFLNIQDEREANASRC